MSNHAGAQTGYAPTNYNFAFYPQETRSLSLASAGTALNADMSSININPARMGLFNEKNSYSFDTYKIPSISNNAYFSSLKYILATGNNSLGASINYFSPGNYQYVSETGGMDFNTKPSEYKITIANARQLTDNSYIGISFNYLKRSRLPQSNINAVNTMAGDIGYVQRFTFKKGNDQQILTGFTLQNIGSKTSDGNFPPTNLSIGTTYLDGYSDENSVLYPFLIGIQFDKLLVPSLPIYNVDGTISVGVDPNTLSGIGSTFGSLFDDPMNKDLAKWRIHTYTEVILENIFTIRSGYSYENPNIGYRSYISLGGGFKWIKDESKYNIDFGILIPTDKTQNPYNNVFSVSFNIKYGNRW